MSRGWIAVDLDCTLAIYRGWPTDGGIGEPIQLMVDRVKIWLAAGDDVRIFTARVWPLGTLDELLEKNLPRTQQAMRQLALIEEWCLTHIGRVLPVTCSKDFSMIELWDDRAVQIEPNTGVVLGRTNK